MVSLGHESLQGPRHVARVTPERSRGRGTGPPRLPLGLSGHGPHAGHFRGAGTVGGWRTGREQGLSILGRVAGGIVWEEGEKSLNS